MTSPEPYGALAYGLDGKERDHASKEVKDRDANNQNVSML
jgi:hypothetical protein